MGRSFGLSANTIKYYAVVAMTIDHIAWVFIPTQSALGVVTHTIGRTVMPIMCFFIAEGFYHTQSVKKYILRMAAFSLISWVPFYFYIYRALPFVRTDNGSIYIIKSFYYTQSILFTLTICLIMLAVVHGRMNIFLKIMLTSALFLLTYLGDWSFTAPAWVLAFDRFRGDFKKQAVSAVLIGLILSPLVLIIVYGVNIRNNLFQLATPLALLPLYFYNGRRGDEGSGRTMVFVNKWGFYVYYILHMPIITLIYKIYRGG
ncbi:MAG: conjugal transfer protein TraX [Oscillospiraceae bacterium]|nr:conjugal transfer protein TraX [Oscillospiraceae bacterium]